MGVVILPLLALVSLNGYAWSETISWVHFNDAGAGPGYHVSINDQTGDYSGYAWSERIGWIKFTGDHARACAATEGGDCSNVTSPNTSGWDGLIKLRGPGYGVRIVGDPTTGCSVSGYAWGSDVVGWLHFNGPTYQVNLDHCIVPIEPPHTFDLSCTFRAAPRRLIAPQRTARLVWTCQDADACSITPGVGGVAPPSGGGRTVAPTRTTTYTLHCSNHADQETDISQTVTVIRSHLCEINPGDPSCQQ